MTNFVKAVAVGTALALIAGWAWRRWRNSQQNAIRRLAMLEFDELRNRLQSDFLAAAAATGKPRGLRWKSCELHDDARFATDTASGELYALVCATISFEAIEGGGMEDVQAVGNLRTATVIFTYCNRIWTTEGRVVFNLEPHEALEHYRAKLQPLEKTPSS